MFGPLNWQGVLGVGAGAFFGGFLLAQNVVSKDVVKANDMVLKTVIANTWERENVAVDREINLYNQQIMDRRSMLELSAMIQKLDTVTGEAREALRAELKRRDEAIRAAQADAQAKADELRRYKTQWGDTLVPDGYVCRMRGETGCAPSPGSDGAAADRGDRVEVRNRGAGAQGAAGSVAGAALP